MPKPPAPPSLKPKDVHRTVVYDNNALDTILNLAGSEELAAEVHLGLDWILSHDPDDGCCLYENLYGMDYELPDSRQITALYRFDSEEVSVVAITVSS